MRAVVQRVQKASVVVNDEVISSIGRGLCVLVGIHRNDIPADIQYLVNKIVNLRVFEDESGKRWKKSVKDYNYEILCISQFTLYSEFRGNKLDYHLAMSGNAAKSFYHSFIDCMKSKYNPDLIKDGEFGAMMQVNIQNDGPVTINIESPVKKSEPDLSNEVE